MELIAPSRVSTKLSRGNAAAFALAFLFVSIGMSSAYKTPTTIVAMSMGCLLFGWLFAATMIAHLTSDQGLLCEAPIHPGECYALDPFPIVVRLENPSTRWPILFLTVEFGMDIAGSILHAPTKFVGLLPPRSAAEFKWHVTVRRRGRVELRGFSARTTFPGSMLSRELFFAFDQTLLALPAVQNLKPKADGLIVGRRHTTGRQPSSPAASEEFVGVREYRPGDNPRNICLALSVRMPDYPWQLVVREFEDPDDNEVCVILDTAIPYGSDGQDPIVLYRFEKAISFSIALCRRLCDQKRTVRFLAYQPVGKTVDLLLKQPSRDLPILERHLARLSTNFDREAGSRMISRQRQVSDSIQLFVSLQDQSVTGRRRDDVIAISPEWQASLLSDGVA